MKKGFTIVELLMVIGIIAVLMGLVTTAASESIRASRQRKAESMCTLVQAAFANYYALEGTWPSRLGTKVASSSFGTNDEEYELTIEEADECIQALVQKTKDGNPVMDVSGLFVCRKDHNVEPYEERCTCSEICKEGQKKKYVARNSNGLDFMSAIHGTKRSPQKMSSRHMHFGYPHPDNGKFMPFRVIYSIPTDSVTVKQWHWPGVSW